MIELIMLVLFALGVIKFLEWDNQFKKEQRLKEIKEAEEWKDCMRTLKNLQKKPTRNVVRRGETCLNRKQ